MIPAMDKKAISLIIASRSPKGGQPEEKPVEEVESEEEFDAETEVMRAFMKAVQANDIKKALTNFKRLIDVCNMDYESDEE